LIACFRTNISAKYYENPTMLSRIIAKNIGDVFLRHSVDSNIFSLPHGAFAAFLRDLARYK